MLAAQTTLAQRFGFPVTVKAKDEIESGRAQTTSLEPHPGQGRIPAAARVQDARERTSGSPTCSESSTTAPS